VHCSVGVKRDYIAVLKEIALLHARTSITVVRVLQCVAVGVLIEMMSVQAHTWNMLVSCNDLQCVLQCLTLFLAMFYSV